MIQSITNNYTDAIQAIKQAILKSRYKAATLANHEMLMLYYGVGEYISQHTREGQWGTNAIELISEQLQKELPGVRGFSATSLKKMRTFYEVWESVFLNRPLSTDEIEISLLSDNTNPIVETALIQQCADSKIDINRPLITDDLTSDDLDCFFRVGFTHHYEIVLKTTILDERLFYIQRCATEFWSVEKLRYNLKSDLYAQQGSLVNNFAKTLSDSDFRCKALRSFKDEYLLDFINIEDPDEEDERMIENEIVRNIKKFIMALGTDFAFIGNQHRLVVDEREFFVDLLFFNRRLQSLVALDLKRKEFKPEYVGKMNFYLSALDEYVKQPCENPSIGIILCKEKSNKIVEFSFRDTNKPMGVATYRTASELPPEYKGILPSAEKLKELLDE
jgi:predicted nuclease of restriction endonuclease-like (RecB) superfamily